MAMDELEISGKRYISTRRAAREHGYHSDYMGQLIRGKKVAGQKVGRAWYIEEESLIAYFSGEQKPAEPVAKKETPTKEAPVVVAAPTPAPEPEPGIEEVAPAEPAPPAAAIVEEPVAAVEKIQIREMPRKEIFINKIQVQEPQEIFVETKSTRVPIHTPMAQAVGGLRYAVDDSPSIPIVVSMPQAYARTRAQSSVVHAAPTVHKQRFPFVSLSVVAVLAITAAAFASNFVSATIVSEPGKSAVVEYAIHW